MESDKVDDDFSVSRVHSFPSCDRSNAMSTSELCDSGVQWQWQRFEESSLEDEEHKEWVSFFSENSRRIELAFQKGLDRTKVKYRGEIPMEIFFYDEVLYNP